MRKKERETGGRFESNKNSTQKESRDIVDIEKYSIIDVIYTQTVIR